MSCSQDSLSWVRLGPWLCYKYKGEEQAAKGIKTLRSWEQREDKEFPKEVIVVYHDLKMPALGSRHPKACPCRKPSAWKSLNHKNSTMTIPAGRPLLFMVDIVST